MGIPRDELIETFRSILKQALPELLDYLDGGTYHILAKVTKIDSKVDVMALKKDGNNDMILPRLDKPMDIPLNIGDIVRVCFYYNDKNMPYIDAKIR
ncbi:MAG: hypothetical protein PWQ97_438 [Tepidanaerobacteraceae bacterium]|nr:hypothetical protein [Tepidanaerobacteraceae bacterium]